MSVTRWGFFVCIGLSSIACAPSAKDKSAASSADTETVTVTVAPLQIQSVRRTVQAVGTLYGYDEATLAPKVDGRVASIRADIGDLIFPGTVLLELDPTDQQLAVAEARQGLIAELVKLGLTELPSGEIELDKVPSVRRALVAEEDAIRRFKLKKDLAARNAVSKDELDFAETDSRLAEATKVQIMTEAKAILALAKLRKASLDIAEQRLRDCKLTAPFPNGYEAWAAVLGTACTPMRYQVAQRLLTEGEMVRAMPVTNAYRLVLDFAVKLRAAVPERASSELKSGQTADVMVDAYPGRIFTGRVTRINPTIDPLNRTFFVEIEVSNSAGELKCGGFARASIRTQLDPLVMTVPHSAVVNFAGVSKVFLAMDGRAKAIEVQTGSREREWVEVIGELPTDAQVITSGQTRLADGTPIRINEEKKEAASNR